MLGDAGLLIDGRVLVADWTKRVQAWGAPRAAASRSCTLHRVSNDSLTELAKVIAEGLPGPNGGLRSYIDALFGERYQSAITRQPRCATPTRSPTVKRAFRTPGSSTRTTDEGILTRPGHKRRITALRRYVARLGVDTVSAARGLGRIVLHRHGTPLPLELLDLAAGVPAKKRVGRALRHDVPPALAREEPTAAAAGSIDRAGAHVAMRGRVTTTKPSVAEVYRLEEST